jgi:putative peptide zinc metalloprotease protein
MAVGAGGMIFELFLAAVAGIIWLSVPDGLLRQIAYNAMFTASVSTVLFNANPLMRFDGYYILSDLLEIPNLQQRSTAMLKWFFERFVYRIKEATPPTSLRDEQVWLVIYGVASFIYRIFVFLSITMYLLGKLFAIGVFLAIWSAAAWFLIPIGGFVHWLATEQRLGDHRLRAVATSLVLIVAAALLIGVIPAPDRRRGEGVIESMSKSGIFSHVDGFVDKVHKRPGEFVRKGEPIVTMSSRQLEARLDLVTGMLAENESLWRDAIVTNPAAAQIAEQKVETLRRQREVLLEKQAQLVVRAPHDGVIVTQDPIVMLGMLVKEGRPICELVDPASLRVVAAMSQEEALWLYERPREDYSVEMRLVSNVGHTFEGGSVRVIDAGQRRLSHQSLSYLGGGTIEVDQSKEGAGSAKNPQFEVQIDPKAYTDGRVVEWLGLPGERVKVRFALKWRPLIGQWVDHVQKLMYGRVNL